MKKLLAKLKTIPYVKYLTDKYVVTLIAFGVWVIFFGQNNLISQYRLSKDLEEFRAEREYYLHEISKNKRAIKLLDNDLEHLEKIAREKYLMKRDNEEIYIFVDENENNN